MIDLNNLSGLFSSTLFLTAGFSLCFPLARLSIRLRSLPVVIWIGLVLIPFGPVSVSAFVRSFIGDLSIPSLVILILILVGGSFGLARRRRKEMDRFCLLLLPGALLFYPLAMGIGKYDPYLLGYGSGYLLGFILLVTLTAWAFEQWVIVFSLSLAVLCYGLGWYESNNLWDYLFDPLLVVYASGLAVFRLVSGFKSQTRCCSDRGSPGK